MNSTQTKFVLETIASYVGGKLPPPWDTVVSLTIKLCDKLMGGEDPDDILKDEVLIAEYPNLGAVRERLLREAEDG